MIWSRIKIFAREMVGAPVITAIAFTLILLSLTLSIIFHSASFGTKQYVKNKFGKSVRPDIIRVRPKEKENSPLIFSLFTTNIKGFSEKKYRALKKIKHTKKVQGLLSVNLPAQAGVRLMGFNYRTDLLFAGAPLSMVWKDLPKNKKITKKWKAKYIEGRDIPLLLPKVLLDTYNNGMAPANGMPSVSAKTIKDFPIELLIGRSSVKTLEGYFNTTGNIVGTSSDIRLLGIIMPIKTAQRLNKIFCQKNRYLYAEIIPKNHHAIYGIKKRVRALGLIPETGAPLSSKIIRLIRKIDLFTAFMLIIITTLAVTAVSLCCITSLWSRIEYYRILRILGASRFLVSTTVLLKFLALGFVGGLLALTLSEKILQEIPSVIKLSGLLSPVGMEKYSNIYLYLSALIPAISTVPGIIRIFYLEMNKN